MAQAAHALSLKFALGQAVDAFERRGIRSLVLKGPAFALWLYDEPAERRYRDVDLLISPDQIEAAKQALAELGFEPQLLEAHAEERPPHHETWHRSSGAPAAIELHRTLFLLKAPPSLVWSRFCEGARAIEIDGVRVQVPSETVGALIVALHAAQHGTRVARPLEDLRRAVERVDRATWRSAAALARELDAEAAFAVGLRLDPAGRELARELGLTRAAPRSVRLGASSPPDTAAGIEQLIGTPTLAGRLRLIAHELAPSKDWMRACDPLARRGIWGLALAYIRRPFLLMLKLPRGLAAWLRVALARPSEPARGRHAR